MSLHVPSGGAWTEASAIWVPASARYGAWTEATEVWVESGGAWVKAWAATPTATPSGLTIEMGAAGWEYVKCSVSSYSATYPTYKARFEMRDEFNTYIDDYITLTDGGTTHTFGPLSAYDGVQVKFRARYEDDSASTPGGPWSSYSSLYLIDSGGGS